MVLARVRHATPPSRASLGLAALLLATTLSAPAGAEQAYGVLFREGVLDTLAEGETIEYAYQRDGLSALPPPGAEADPPLDATVTLSVAPARIVELALAEGERRQGVGKYPQDVGNPLIMVFLETLLRDMASQSGGSPFYIRNRLKESLLTDVEVTEVPIVLEGGREATGQQVSFHPFENDAARDRMAGFADLEIVAVVSEEVPGWYYSLSAAAPALPGSDAPGYETEMSYLPEDG